MGPAAAPTGPVSGAARAATPADSLGSAAGSRDPLEGRPIARVEVEPHRIFDTLPGGRLTGLFRLADRLHVRTRTSTIRTHMILAPGQSWSDARARECERALRALDIFDVVRVEGRPSGSGGDSVVALIWTRDAWTTSPEFSLERGGGELFGSVQFTERNLLGRAQQINVSYREDPTGISRSIGVADPGVSGTRIRASMSAGDGSSGTTVNFAVGMPFWSEDAPLAFSIFADRANTTSRLFQDGAEVASFARRFERLELSLGRGRRFDRTIARLGGSILVLDRSYGGSTLQPGAPIEFDGGEERLRVRRFTVEGRLWQPAFVEATGVERLDGIEDIDLGRSLTVALGYSPRALGATVEDGFAAVRLEAGTAPRRPGYGWMRLGLTSRLVDGPREATGRIEARWVNQTLPRHTLVVAALGAAGWRNPRDFQLVVGGLNGLRAHDVHALAGDRLWRWNAESRWLIGRDLQQLVSLGTAVFWDAAQTWGPGSSGEPWQHDVGIGLRLGLPRSAHNRVARFDVAWPVAPGRHSLREAVFSFGSSQAF